MFTHASFGWDRTIHTGRILQQGAYWLKLLCFLPDQMIQTLRLQMKVVHFSTSLERFGLRGRAHRGIARDIPIGILLTLPFVTIFITEINSMYVLF